MTILTDKKALRALSKDRRASLSANARAEASLTACNRLFEALTVYDLPKPMTIAGYAAHGSELDVSSALTLLGDVHSLALPVIKHGDRDMHFCRYRLGETLQAGRHSILEPQEPLEIVTPDIVIVPLLAFDRSFHRLGYGKGYYDTALEALRAKNPALLAIGMGFSIQEAPSVGALPHDQMLDWIVTEKEVIMRA